MKRWLSCIAAFAVGLGLAGVPRSTSAADVLEINVIDSISGQGAFVGKGEATSLQVLETTLNKAGGVDGRQVKFVILDDQSNPQIAVQLANRLLAQNAPVIIGPSLVSGCQALAPLVKGKAVMWCISSAFHPEPGSYGFYSGFSTIDQLVFSMRYLRERGITKVASMTSLDANGVDTDRGIALALARPENKGMSLVAAEHFNLADLTVDAQMARIKASGAQALINYNTGTPFGTVLHGYSDLGMTIPIVTQPAALNYATVTQYAAFLPKELLITGLVGDAPSVAPARGPVREALNTYYDAFKEAGIRPDHVTGLAWDPALIIVSAYKKFGLNMTATQLNDYIQNLRGWAGINGVYDFHAGQSGLTSKSLVMVRWDAPSKSWVAVSKAGGS